MIRTWRPAAVIALAGSLVLAGGCSGQRSAWEEVKSAHTEEAYEGYLKQFPKGEYATRARGEIRGIHYRRAKKADTIAAYEAFLGRYPAGKDLYGNSSYEALTRIIQLRFEEARRENTIRAYERFFERFPYSEYWGRERAKIRNAADDLYFKRVREVDTVLAHRRYYRRFLFGGRHVGEARAYILKKNPLEGHLGGRKYLIHMLYSRKAVDRGQAAMKMGMVEEIPYLIDALNDRTGLQIVSVPSGSSYVPGGGGTPTSVAGLAAESLAKMGRPAVGPLVEALRDTNSKTRAGAARALGAVARKMTYRKEEEIYAALERALREDTVPLVRAAAAGALSSLKAESGRKDGRVFPLLRRAMEDESYLVGEEAVNALIRLRDPRGIDPLKHGMAHPNKRVRKRCAEGLEFLIRELSLPGDPKTQEALIRALDDPDQEVQYAAAKALGRIADPRSLEALEAALRRSGAKRHRRFKETVGFLIQDMRKKLGTAKKP